MNTISFPGLGIEPFEVNRVAFTLPIGDGIDIMWYALIITAGFLLAFLYACLRSKRSEGIKIDDLIDLLTFVILFGVLGARLYYVVMSPDEFDSFLDVINIRSGGLAIYGGLICGILAIVGVCKVKKLNLWRVLDTVGPGVMIAQALGRWGNFFNGEAYGSILKYEFLGKTFETSRFAGQAIPWIMTIENVNGSALYYAHPTFLYESLWNVLGFILLNIRYKNKKFDGQILFSYLVWYGFGRMFIEGYRTDSLYLGNVRISQLVALGCVIFGVMFYHLLRKKAKPVLKAEQDAQEYESLFSDKPAKKKKSSSAKTAEVKADTADSGSVTPTEETTEVKTEESNDDSNAD